MKSKSFYFLGDLIKSEVKFPIKLFNNFSINKANTKQVEVIKNVIDKYDSILTFNINKYESSYEKEKNGGYSVGDLEKSKWKYYVVEFSEPKSNKPLPLIFSLSKLNLSLLFEATVFSIDEETGRPLYGTIQSQLRTINYFHDNHRRMSTIPETKSLTILHIQELREIDLKLSQFESDKFPFIQKALTDFISIKDISENSPFKILSSFAILELLLTTYKQKNSNDNSISNQLKKKINLLNNQFVEKIEFQKYFKGSNTNTLETVIEKLYQFRNDIAHGNLSDFETELRIFKNHRMEIQYFLIELLRKILIFSVENPQLVKDLKDC